MTERNVSREQAIALWLAKLVYGDAVIMDGRVYAVNGAEWIPWNPHHDRAQWAEVIEWAAVNGIRLHDCGTHYETPWRETRGLVHKVAKDNTPAGVRDAALEACARATGWPGMEEK